MSKFRLALVRQKYRPDGGAERFVSRALEALDDSDLELNVITREWQGPVKPDWQIHICNPRKWGRISRERGFAIDDQERAEGMRSVAAPIFNADAEPIAALAVSGPAFRMGLSDATRYGALVRAAADQVTEATGGVRPARG